MAHGSLSHFKAALERKKSRDAKRRKTFDDGSQAYKSLDAKTEYSFPELSDAEMETVKEDIRKKLEADKRKERLIGAVIIVTVVIALAYFIYKKA
ncbi:MULTISPECIES: hypothetical protein [Bizionia]|uniref:Uncharacterized protein n=1 Tax=Bizionia algoritergicola TaxID=291187 RepID=A0A5D0R2L6_9FLAO|nr:MULTISPECIES: hypothetical protein [Bizionia]OBX24348.1 hypothetical protein BAA08_00705 [Bizionia sp. APA-3]TYB75269.1 hypothetical protein ES675_03845 [Bizionia algoritergicola]